jgi:hypothetical protein
LTAEKIKNSREKIIFKKKKKKKMEMEIMEMEKCV